MAVRATRDAADKQKDLHRDYQIDESQILNPQPGKHYKPVNVKRLDHWRQRGYKLTPAKDKAKLLGAHKSKEGGQQNGDLVLMETTREIRNARIRRGKDRGKMQESSYRENARENINRIAKDEAHVKTRRDLVIDDSYEGEGDGD